VARAVAQLPHGMSLDELSRALRTA
jgi:hypothetical protein